MVTQRKFAPRKRVRTSQTSKRKTSASTALKSSVDVKPPIPVHESINQKLERLVPLFTDNISKLLAAKGMLRDKKEFQDKVREIMDEKEEE